MLEIFVLTDGRKLEIEFDDIYGIIKPDYREYIQKMLNLDNKTMEIVMTMNKEQFIDFLNNLFGNSVDTKELIRIAKNITIPLDPDAELENEVVQEEEKEQKIKIRDNLIRLYGDENVKTLLEHFYSVPKSSYYIDKDVNIDNFLEECKKSFINKEKEDSLVIKISDNPNIWYFKNYFRYSDNEIYEYKNVFNKNIIFNNSMILITSTNFSLINYTDILESLGIIDLDSKYKFYHYICSDIMIYGFFSEIELNTNDKNEILNVYNEYFDFIYDDKETKYEENTTNRILFFKINASDNKINIHKYMNNIRILNLIKNNRNSIQLDNLLHYRHKYGYKMYEFNTIYFTFPSIHKYNRHWSSFIKFDLCNNDKELNKDLFGFVYCYILFMIKFDEKNSSLLYLVGDKNNYFSNIFTQFISNYIRALENLTTKNFIEDTLIELFDILFSHINNIEDQNTRDIIKEDFVYNVVLILAIFNNECSFMNNNNKTITKIIKFVFLIRIIINNIINIVDVISYDKNNYILDKEILKIFNDTIIIKLLILYICFVTKVLEENTDPLTYIFSELLKVDNEDYKKIFEKCKKYTNFSIQNNKAMYDIYRANCFLVDNTPNNIASVLNKICKNSVISNTHELINEFINLIKNNHIVSLKINKIKLKNTDVLEQTKQIKNCSIVKISNKKIYKSINIFEDIATNNGNCLRNLMPKFNIEIPDKFDSKKTKKIQVDKYKVYESNYYELPEDITKKPLNKKIRIVDGSINNLFYDNIYDKHILHSKGLINRAIIQSINRYQGFNSTELIMNISENYKIFKDTKNIIKDTLLSVESFNVDSYYKALEEIFMDGLCDFIISKDEIKQPLLDDNLFKFSLLLTKSDSTDVENNPFQRSKHSYLSDNVVEYPYYHPIVLYVLMFLTLVADISLFDKRYMNISQTEYMKKDIKIWLTKQYEYYNNSSIKWPLSNNLFEKNSRSEIRNVFKNIKDKCINITIKNSIPLSHSSLLGFWNTDYTILNIIWIFCKCYCDEYIQEDMKKIKEKIDYYSLLFNSSIQNKYGNYLINLENYNILLVISDILHNNYVFEIEKYKINNISNLLNNFYKSNTNSSKIIKEYLALNGNESEKTKELKTKELKKVFKLMLVRYCKWIYENLFKEGHEIQLKGVPDFNLLSKNSYLVDQYELLQNIPYTDIPFEELTYLTFDYNIKYICKNDIEIIYMLTSFIWLIKNHEKNINLYNKYMNSTLLEKELLDYNETTYISYLNKYFKTNNINNDYLIGIPEMVKKFFEQFLENKEEKILDNGDKISLIYNQNNTYNIISDCGDTPMYEKIVKNIVFKSEDKNESYNWMNKICSHDLHYKLYNETFLNNLLHSIITGSIIFVYSMWSLFELCDRKEDNFKDRLKYLENKFSNETFNTIFNIEHLMDNSYLNNNITNVILNQLNSTIQIIIQTITKDDEKKPKDSKYGYKLRPIVKHLSRKILTEINDLMITEPNSIKQFRNVNSRNTKWINYIITRDLIYKLITYEDYGIVFINYIKYFETVYNNMPNYILRNLEYKQLHTDKNLMREYWKTILLFFYTPLIYKLDDTGIDAVNKNALYTDFVKNIANYNNVFAKKDNGLTCIQPSYIAISKAYFIICRKYFNPRYLKYNEYDKSNINKCIEDTLLNLKKWKDEYNENKINFSSSELNDKGLEVPNILDDFITKYDFLIKSYFTSYLDGYDDSKTTIIDIISNKDNLIDDFTDLKTTGGDFEKTNDIHKENDKLTPMIEKNKLPVWLTIIIIVGITMVLTTIIICLCCFIGKKQNKSNEMIQKENFQTPIYHYRKIPNGYGGYNTQIVNKPNKFSAYGV